MTIANTTPGIYEDLGVRPMINAAGAYTLLGGSVLSPVVQAAMDAANHSFVEMKSLMDSSGRIIAELLGCEAAYVTAGAASGLALASAACMTGKDRARMEQLPDPAGMPYEVLIQTGLRSKYDRCVEVPGAKLRPVGDPGGPTSREQLEAAIGPQTAAVHFLAPGEFPGVLPLPEVMEIAHAHGVPVIVDAAGQSYPVDNLRRFARMGADLVIYAGKYFDGPHSTGIITGKRELVEAAALNGFVSFETEAIRTIGRPMKIDRQEIVGMVVALREWLAMDHEARFVRYGERASAIIAALEGLPGVSARMISSAGPVAPVQREGVRIEVDSALAARSAEDAVQALKDGEPGIWTAQLQPGAITVSVAYLADGEEAVVAQRLRQVLGG